MRPKRCVTSSALAEIRPVRCRRTQKPTHYWLCQNRKSAERLYVCSNVQLPVGTVGIAFPHHSCLLFLLCPHHTPASLLTVVCLVLDLKWRGIKNLRLQHVYTQTCWQSLFDCSFDFVWVCVRLTLCLLKMLPFASGAKTLLLAGLLMVHKCVPGRRAWRGFSRTCLRGRGARPPSLMELKCYLPYWRPGGLGESLQFLIIQDVNCANFGVFLTRK